MPPASTTSPVPHGRPAGGAPTANEVEPLTGPAATREAMLSAAERLFSERGYAAVGTRELAELAGVNIAAIKYHFGCKAELYLEAVRRAMSRGDAARVWDVLRRAPQHDSSEAPAALAAFIHLLLRRLLLSPSAQITCNLLLREAAEPSEAIDAVIDAYVTPHRQAMAEVIKRINPALDEQQTTFSAVSVFGQILHYRVMRPFIERGQHVNLCEPAHLAAIARHIATFSLRGIGCDAPTIDRALSRAAEIVRQVPSEASDSTSV